MGKRKKQNITKNKSVSGYALRRIAGAVGFSAFRYVLLISIGYVVIYPLLYMIVTSLRTASSYSDPSAVWIVESTFQNFQYAFKGLDYATVVKNTLVMRVLSALMEIASCSVVAYGLARFKFRLRKVLMVILILMIIVPSQMIIIPMMMNYAHLDFLGILDFLGRLTGYELRPCLLNTPFAFYLPSIFGVGLRAGVMIFIYIQFFKGLPKELEEAAWIDGANPFKTFLSISVPSSGVVFLAVSVFSVVWHWNDYYLSMMFMNNNKILSLSLATLRTRLPSLGLGFEVVNGVGGSILMAACVLTVLPPLILYLIIQRNFVKSIDRVGITG